MKKTTKFLIIISLFFLQNCSWLNSAISARFPNSGNFVNRFPINKQGIILFKLSSKYPTTTWCKYDEKQTVSIDDCFDLKPSKYYQILMLETGLYEIRGFEQTGRLYKNNALNPKFGGLNQQRKTKPEMAFEVKQDKILFLGEVNFRSSKLLPEKSHDEEFLEIKNAFKNQDLKQLNKIFNGHKVEANILNEKLNGTQTIINDFLENSAIKTKSDFKVKKIKKLKKTKSKTAKKPTKKSKYEN